MKKKSKKKKQSILKKKIFKGFTLVELLAVIVILAIIMVIAIPSVLSVMKSSKQKSFTEYVQKVRNLGEQTYLSEEASGTIHDTATMYDIETDLGLDNTGDYHGYVLAVKDNNEVKYYVTLWNDDYMVYGIEYNDDFTTDALVDYNSSDISTYLSKENLAGVANCTSYTNASDGTVESGDVVNASTSYTYSMPSANVTVKNGQYINYYPTETSYTSLAENNGCSSNSTIDPSELTSWRVLRTNDDGTIDIVSVYVSTNNMSFCGRKGFLNFVDELNKAAEAYKNPKYAESAKSYGYNGQTAILTDTTAIDSTTPPWTTDTADSSNEALGGGDILYQYDANQMSKSKIGYVATMIDGEGTSFWIASRTYIYDSSKNNWYFAGRRGTYGGGLWYGDFIDYWNGSQGTRSHGQKFRPIVTLKAKVKIASGSGSKDDPYELAV